MPERHKNRLYPIESKRVEFVFIGFDGVFGIVFEKYIMEVLVSKNPCVSSAYYLLLLPFITIYLYLKFISVFSLIYNF